MPDKKISELTLLTAAQTDVAADSIPIVDASETNTDRKTKRIFPSALKEALSLNLVDNTSDADKPISAATQTALDAKTPKVITTNTQTASYTLVAGDADKIVEMNVGTANNVTVPSATFSAGQQIIVTQYGAGQTSFVAGSGMTIRSNGGKLKLNAQYTGATLVFRSASECYLWGDITS